MNDAVAARSNRSSSNGAVVAATIALVNPAGMGPPCDLAVLNLPSPGKVADEEYKSEQNAKGYHKKIGAMQAPLNVSPPSSAYSSSSLPSFTAPSTSSSSCPSSC